MKRVLVTGASGFIGRHSLRSLLTGDYEVHAVSSRLPQIRLPSIYWHQANLLDSRQIQKLITNIQPTHVLHFAWFVAPGAYWSSLENIRWVQASLELLQVFTQHGGQRVVMAGSCAEYDWNYGYCSEQITPLDPATLYGTCKHALQSILDAFAKQAGLSAAWGRIFSLYGPHEHPSRLVASVVRSLLASEPARCSHGNQLRDFLFVQDVADAFVALLDSDVSGAVNIGSGQPLALRDIILTIARKLGRLDLIQLGALPAPANDPRLLVAQIDRLTNEVKWRPKYDIDHGILQSIDWWRNHSLEVQR